MFYFFFLKLLNVLFFQIDLLRLVYKINCQNQILKEYDYNINNYVIKYNNYNSDYLIKYNTFLKMLQVLFKMSYLLLTFQYNL